LNDRGVADIMSNYWSETDDVLVHENRGTVVAGVLLFIAVTAMIPFITSGWLTVAACLMCTTLFGLGAMDIIARVEFDRRSGTMRQRNVLGLKWTDRIDRYASVQVVRTRGGLGYRRIEVNLKRAGVVRYSETPKYVVAMYGFNDDATATQAREWGERLARFLKIPLDVDL
jgi:hypothetical protein